MHGEGPLDLVFVPGFVSHVELVWEEPAIARFLRRLASFSRLVFFDKRGQGLSDRLGPAADAGGVDGRPRRGDGRGRLRAGGDLRHLRGRADVDALRRDLPRAGLLAGPLRDLRADARRRPTSRRASAPSASTTGPSWCASSGAARSRVDLWAPSEAGNPEFERWWARLLRQGTSPAGAIELMDLYREIDVRPALPAIGVPTLVLHRARRPPDPRPPGAATWPSGSPARATSSCRAPTTCRRSATRTRCSTRSRSSWSAAAAPTKPNGRWRRSSSPTSSARPRPRRGSATARWRDLLERHDATVRRELAVHRGREVKTMGDGFLATFDGPARAIRCAMRDPRRAAQHRHRDPRRHPHRRGRADRRRRRRHGGQHRRPGRRAGRRRRGARLQHRARAGRRLRDRVRGARRAPS